MIKSFSARNISAFSMIPGEQEYILLPATQFKVLSNKMNSEDEDLHEITLEEIETISDSKLMALKVNIFFLLTNS